MAPVNGRFGIDDGKWSCVILGRAQSEREGIFRKTEWHSVPRRRRGSSSNHARPFCRHVRRSREPTPVRILGMSDGHPLAASDAPLQTVPVSLPVSFVSDETRPMRHNLFLCLAGETQTSEDRSFFRDVQEFTKRKQSGPTSAHFLDHVQNSCVSQFPHPRLILQDFIDRRLGPFDPRR